MEPSIRPPRPKRTERPVAITDVAVVDPVAAAVWPAQTVVVRDGRIAAVAPATEQPVPADAEIVAGAGRFLIPGLWDMHAHFSSPSAPAVAMPLCLANGVTGVRDLCSDAWPGEDRQQPTIADFKRWRRRIADGELVGPRLLALGSVQVDGPGRVPPGAPAFLGAATAADARRLVRYVHERGVDYLKVYSNVPRDGYLALLDEAAKWGLPVAGHKPFAVTGIEAATAGQRSIEHALEILFDLFPGAEEVRRRPGYFPPTTVRRRMIDEHDHAAAEALFAVLAETGTLFTPTHLTRRMDAFADDAAMRRDARLRYVPRDQQTEWAADADRMVAIDPTAGGRAAFGDFYRLGLGFTGRAHAAGVKLLAGTDAGDTFIVHGFALHDELAELVAAGLTPAAALLAATLQPAAFLGLDRHYGSVGPGKVADLVLLAADPLADIRHTRAIEAVLFDGNLYDRGDLDALLASVAGAVEHLDAAAA